MGEKTGAAKAERGGARWQTEKKAVRRVYWWLLLSPFITVPCFAFQLFDLGSRSSVGERVWAVVVPLIFHTPLLLMSFGTGNRFVRRHMQQALLLIALRAGLAAISLNLGRHPGNGLWLFFLGNGSLWLFGSLGGFGQVKRGDCWLMRRKGEGGELPRPWAVPADAAAPTAPVPTDAPTRAAPSLAVHSLPEASADPNVAFEKGLSLLHTDKQAEAADCFLTAFRTGPPDLRHRALAELEKLGEVETF